MYKPGEVHPRGKRWDMSKLVAGLAFISSLKKGLWRVKAFYGFQHLEPFNLTTVCGLIDQ